MENQLKFQVTRMHKLEKESTVKAYVDLAVNESLLCKGLRIVEGRRGLFVSMPREKGKDLKWYETVRPLSREIKELITLTVLAAYNEKD